MIGLPYICSMQEKFKKVLKKYNKKQGEIAQSLGITTQALGGRVRNNPTYESLKEIAGVIGCEICELIDDSKKIQLIMNDKLHTFYSIEELKDFINNQ